jgi:hypothetical protein
MAEVCEAASTCKGALAVVLSLPGADCVNIVGKEGIKVKGEAKEGGAVAIEIVVKPLRLKALILPDSLLFLTTAILWRSPDTL